MIADIILAAQMELISSIYMFISGGDSGWFSAFVTVLYDPDSDRGRIQMLHLNKSTNTTL